MPLPVVKPKMELPAIPMNFVSTLFDQIDPKNAIYSPNPLTFERLKQRNGYILYSTNITIHPSDPALLTINGLADRAFIFVDSVNFEKIFFEDIILLILIILIILMIFFNYIIQLYVGTLSRTQHSYQIPININNGSKLDILVENQGRVCFGDYISELKVC